jgi:hypothetical protein
MNSLIGGAPIISFSISLPIPMPVHRPGVVARWRGVLVEWLMGQRDCLRGGHFPEPPVIMVSLRKEMVIGGSFQAQTRRYCREL